MEFFSPEVFFNSRIEKKWIFREKLWIKYILNYFREKTRQALKQILFQIQ